MSGQGVAPVGNAYGSDPRYHHFVDGAFVCSAPEDAKCRTSPTCECENWCCCDQAAVDHDEGDHCCMTETKPGQGCWIKVWVDAADACDCIERVADEDGDLVVIADGAVVCDWDDGICCSYAATEATP